MKNHLITSPKLLLLCLSAIGSGAALAQQLGAIPVTIGANPAFIQSSPTSPSITVASVAAPVATSATATKAKPAAVETPAAKTALAQDEKPKPVPDVQKVPEKPAAEPVAAKAEANPMTGQGMDIEALTHEYEKEKLRAAIASEKQKRANAENSAANTGLPPPLANANAKAPLMPGQLQPQANTPPSAAPQTVMPPVKAPKVVKAKPVPVQPTFPTLVGTVMQNGERYAIIEQGGDSVVVKQGQSAFGQTVGRVSDNSVSLGGQMLTSQPAGVMRVARTDTPSTSSTTGSATGNGALPAPLGPGVNPNLPMTLPTQGMAPVNNGMVSSAPMGAPTQ